MYINLTNPNVQEFDIDEETKISCIKAVTSDNESFYVLANKWNGKLGYYILKINQKDPLQYSFLVHWSNKLEINDGDLSIMKETLTND